MTIVCIDPGHVSENVGTRGRRVTEVRAVWEVATRLKAILQKDGYTVVMTKRSFGEKVLNRRRAEIANGARADLMVRLHCDAGSGSGFAVYYPAAQGTAQGRKGPSAAVLRTSADAARRFHPALGLGLKGWFRDNGLKTDAQTYVGGRQGALTGSIFSEVPVVLVEMAVLTSPAEEIRLITGYDRYAKALAGAVRATILPTRPGPTRRG